MPEVRLVQPRKFKRDGTPKSHFFLFFPFCYLCMETLRYLTCVGEEWEGMTSGYHAVLKHQERFQDLGCGRR